MPYGEALFDGIARLLHVPEPWTRAAFLVLAGLFLGWASRKLVKDFWLPLAKRTRTPLDEIVVETIAAPVAWSFVFLGATGAARILQPSPDYAVLFERALVTGFLVIWGAAAAHLLSLLLSGAARTLPGDAHAHAAVLLKRFVKIAVAVVILLTLFTVWDVDVTPVLASAGLVGIALALAAQDTLSNFFAGLAVYFDRLYVVGDFVVLDQGNAGEIRGEVKDVGLRSTRILTRDDVLVTVPNGVIASSRVVNESGHVPRYRVRVGVSVAYESDLEHVERVLLEVADGHPLVLPDPSARVRVRRFADSGIEVELLAWIHDPEDRGLVVHELSMRVHKRFGEERIRIPFPQRDLHFNPRVEE